MNVNADPETTTDPETATDSSRRTNAPRRSTPLLDELDREWALLRRRRSARRTVRRWIADDLVALPPTTTDVDDVVDATAGDRAGLGDERLRALVALAPSDPLATRVVLQRLLPGLVAAARRWRATDSTHPVDVVISGAWEAIHGFDPSRRPSRIAPALISDSLWISLRRDSRRRSHDEVPVAQEAFAFRPSSTPRIDAATALAATIRAAGLAGVTDHDLDLLRSLAEHGSTTAVAQLRGVTARTVRNHRDIAAHEVRRALGTDWSDWDDPILAVA
ncbi:MAG: hypothetical protein AB8G26_11945 [Ilumatobacter sp.]